MNEVFRAMKALEFVRSSFHFSERSILSFISSTGLEDGQSVPS